MGIIFEPAGCFELMGIANTASSQVFMPSIIGCIGVRLQPKAKMMKDFFG
jgi:hypothetical protein